MKPDAAEIAAVMAEVQQAGWLGRSRRRLWPHYVYRFTDAQNVVGILNAGRVYSRRRAKELGLIHVDSASSAIIRQSPWAHRYARLYFRPLTPTQYHVEGIRPPGERYMDVDRDAHCPMPVMLLFAAVSVLCSPGCEFSRGSLARSRYEVGSDAAFLAGQNFRDIYHDGALPSDRKDELKNAIQAEVLVPDELELEHCAAIVCRSGAERDTLLTQLDASGAQCAPALRTSIRIQRPDEHLFYEDWAYVDDVRLIEDRLHFVMHVPSGRSGGRHVTFSDELRVTNGDSGEELVVEDRQFRMMREFSYQLPWNPTRAYIRYELEGCLAFMGTRSQVSLL